MTQVLTKPNMPLSKKDVKESIEAKYPSMPRYKRIKLITKLLKAYQWSIEAAELLGETVPNEPCPENCDISEEYIILRDINGDSIADVYAGENAAYLNHIIFSSGNELTEHTMWLLRGKSDEHGYIEECRCGDCDQQRALVSLDTESEHLSRNSTRVLTVPSISTLKVRGISDELAQKMRDSTVIADTSSGPKIMHHEPMVRDGNTSVRLST